MTKNTLKSLEILNAHLEDVKAKIDILKDELDDTKSYSLNLRKAQVIRDIVETLEELHPQLEEAKEAMTHLKHDCEHRNSQINKKLFPELKKILELSQNARHDGRGNYNFKRNNMKTTYLNHLCVLGLAGALFACGGGSSSTPAPATSNSSGGTATSSSGGGNAVGSSSGGTSNTTTSSGGNGNTPDTSTSSSGGNDKKSSAQTVTLAQAISRVENPFTSQNVALEGVDTTIAGGNRTDAFKRETRTISIKAERNGSNQITGYALKISDVNYNTNVLAKDKPTSVKANPALLSPDSGFSVLKSLDGNWNALLKGSDTSSFKYLRRFEERKITPGNTRLDNRRFGVFGLRTDVTNNTPQEILKTAGADATATVTYSGTLDGYFQKDGLDTPYKRSVTFNINLADNSITSKFGAASFPNQFRKGTAFDTLEITGTGTISGNGFTIPVQNVTFNTGAADCGTAGICPTGFTATPAGNSNAISGHFYGERAQEVGGIVHYSETGTKRTAFGAFGATRPGLSKE